MTSPVVQHSQNGVAFLDHVCESLTLNVSFSVLAKCWPLISLSKLSEDYTILEKWIQLYVLILVSMDL